jgi:hypothetical protein
VARARSHDAHRVSHGRDCLGHTREAARLAPLCAVRHPLPVAHYEHRARERARRRHDDGVRVRARHPARERGRHHGLHVCVRLPSLRSLPTLVGTRGALSTAQRLHAHDDVRCAVIGRKRVERGCTAPPLHGERLRHARQERRRALRLVQVQAGTHGASRCRARSEHERARCGGVQERGQRAPQLLRLVPVREGREPQGRPVLGERERAAARPLHPALKPSCSTRAVLARERDAAHAVRTLFRRKSMCSSAPHSSSSPSAQGARAPKTSGLRPVSPTHPPAWAPRPRGNAA